MYITKHCSAETYIYIIFSCVYVLIRIHFLYSFLSNSYIICLSSLLSRVLHDAHKLIPAMSAVVRNNAAE